MRGDNERTATAIALPGTEALVISESEFRATLGLVGNAVFMPERVKQVPS